MNTNVTGSPSPVPGFVAALRSEWAASKSRAEAQVELRRGRRAGSAAALDVSGTACGAYGHERELAEGSRKMLAVARGARRPNASGIAHDPCRDLGADQLPTKTLTDPTATR